MDFKSREKIRKALCIIGSNVIFNKKEAKRLLKIPNFKEMKSKYNFSRKTDLMGQIVHTALSMIAKDVCRGYIFILPTFKQKGTISLYSYTPDEICKTMKHEWADDYDPVNSGFKLYMPKLNLVSKYSYHRVFMNLPKEYLTEHLENINQCHHLQLGSNPRVRVHRVLVEIEDSRISGSARTFRPLFL